MFGTDLLGQLIVEIIGVILVPVLAVVAIGLYCGLAEFVSDIPFYRYYFTYKKDLRLKDLELNRPMRVKKDFWQEWGMFYVHYTSESPRVSLVAKLGRQSKRFREGDVFVVLPCMRFWRRIELYKEPV